MDLTCHERLVADNCFAERDTALFDDMRVLRNLLASEIKYLPTCNYFTNVQNNLKPFMRKIVTEWMLEVCEEQRCENQVFPLAVNFLDRFLCVCPIPRHHLQLLSAVCLLLASKIRQCNALTIELLVFYSDSSFTPSDARSWEMLVLSKLQWNMSAITGCDIVDHVLERMPWSRGNSQIRRHAHTLLSLCYTEIDFMLTKSSLLAAASILAAANGLKVADCETVLGSVCGLTGCVKDDVTRTAAIVDGLVITHFNAHQQQQQQLSVPQASVDVSIAASHAVTDQAMNIQSAHMETITMPPKTLTPPPPPTSERTPPSTPTDIQEILF